MSIYTFVLLVVHLRRLYHALFYLLIPNRPFKIYHFSQIVTCYASFHQLYLFTIFLYETVPPKRSRALPIVKSSCPPPKLRNRSKSSSELIPPAYVIGIFPIAQAYVQVVLPFPIVFPLHQRRGSKTHHNKKIISQEQRRSNVDSYILPTICNYIIIFTLFSAAQIEHDMLFSYGMNKLL